MHERPKDRKDRHVRPFEPQFLRATEPPALRGSIEKKACIATTGFAANTSLARGREKRTKVRPVKIAVNPSPHMISIVTTTWPYNVEGYIAP
jgi:hypothetical protein